jgi:hypothetical protein
VSITKRTKQTQIQTLINNSKKIYFLTLVPTLHP